VTQLDIWRIQAQTRLDELLAALQGDLTPADGLIDSLIRRVVNQPPRPADKLPYASIFGTADVATGRSKALGKLPDLDRLLTGEVNPLDGLVDDAVRSLSQHSPRPADTPPYASLFAPSAMVWLTPQILSTIAPEADPDRVATLVPHLNRTMVIYDITTPLRQAHFLAQVAHESDRFNALEEYASGEDYEFRDDLGNVYAGDGIRYKGRGLIQVTGRTNYELCSTALGFNLIDHPERLSEPNLACRSAGWFWHRNRLNPDADNDDIETVTRIINGGLNGFSDRQHLLKTAKAEFSL
jgi:putative chitinase